MTASGVLLAKPPVGEQGAPANVGIVPWGSMWIGDDLELVPELQWPMSVVTYTGMMNDSQIEGLHIGTTLPIRNYLWEIDRNGCDVERTKLLAADLGLPVRGADQPNRGRSRGRFSHDEHLAHSLKALQFGHYPFEIVAEYRPGDPIAHIKKVAARPPSTIAEVSVERDGSLRHIKQNVSVVVGQGSPEIPAERLLYYTWDKEGANWFGRSMLRSIYRNWLIKDRLLRVDALKHERNGMGVPVGIGGPGYGKTELMALGRIAGSMKAGEASGTAIPHGSDLKLLGVSGTLPDTIASIRFHNEEMARRYMMMFMQLGESMHGSRSLGESFIDFFEMYQEAIAKWYAEKTTSDLIESWWNWNVDPQSESTPQLVYTPSVDAGAAFGPLANLITSGAIQVDDDLEEAVRQAMKLPKKGTPRVLPTAPDPTQPGTALPAGAPENQPGVQAAPVSAGGTPSQVHGPTAKRQERSGGVGVSAVTSSPAAALPLPARPLRRQPAEYEVTAQVDFATMDIQWQLNLDQLFRDWQNQVTASQIDHVHAAISKTANLETLASLEAPAIGSGILESAMRTMYAEGVRQAIDEAKAQGHAIAEPNADDYTKNFAARAKAVDEINARTIGNMAGARALRLSGGKLNREEVAAQTREYLNGLAFAMLRDRLGGALTAAVNSGRRAVMAEGPAARYYSSEILDNNTCVPCSGVDGTEYVSLSDSERDYPGGGYVDCAGGDRCRGTLVAVYTEDNTAEVIG